MRFMFAVSLCATVVASPLASAPAPVESWGKAGIALAQYRQDALECGLKGYYTDIAKTQDAKEFVRASRELDTVSAGAMGPSTTGSNGTGPAMSDSLDQAARYADMQQHIIEGVRPDQRMRNIKKTLIANDQQCLVQRGYSKFVLTDDQRHALHRLKAGSDERRAYLYSLATNPAVLQGQRAPAQP
jgi:hypothetical protein